MQYLIVVRPFETYKIGDIVTDEKVVDRILGSEHSAHVVCILPPVEG